MKNMTFENIAKACDGELFLNGAEAGTEIKGAVIDSRLVKENYLFFATKGERVDGHDYIAKAFELGATIAVCEHIPEGVEGSFIVVKDTFAALKQIAKFYREGLDIKVVGITGSVGKTSTKEFIASVLAQKYKVLKTEGNFNNEVGLPLTVLKLREEHEVAVLEMGISDFGEMTRLSEIAQPDVCVITNIGQCHLEQLGDRDGVLKAKTEVFANLKENGTACLFAEDDKLAGIAEVNGKKPVFYGTGESSEVYASDVVNKGLFGSECVIHAGNMKIKAEIPLPGKHMVYNALAATAVAKTLGLSAEQIEKGIRSVEAVSGRSHLIQTSEYTIIDDCYNANPVSMKAAVDLLGEANTRKVAILGDMFELGENEKALHRSVGEYAAKQNVDALICVGALSEEIYQGAVECEDKKDAMELYHFATLEDCKNEVAGLLKQGDAVLIKASHGMHFTELVELLTQENEPACEMQKAEGTKETDIEIPERTKEEGNETMEEIKKDNAAVEDAYSKAMEEVKKNGKEVLPIEEEVSAQDENKTWVQKNKKFVVISIAVVSVLIIGCIVGLILYNRHYQSLTRGMLFYQDNGCVMTEKAIFADTVYSDQWNSWNFNAKDANNDENPAAVTTDGKYVYFAMNTNGNVFDLYYAKKGSKKATLICQGVTDYEVADKGEVYYAANGGFYQYLVKDANVQNLCNDADTFRLSAKKDAALILGGNDGKLTTIALDTPGSLTTLETGVTKIMEAEDAFKTIVYEKEDGLYMLTAKTGEKVLIGKDYTECYVYNIDKKCEVYYLTDARGLYYYKAGAKETVLVTLDAWRCHGADSDTAMFFVAVGPISEQCVYRLVTDGEAIEMKDVYPMDIKDDIYFDTTAKKEYFIGYADDNDTVGTLYAMGYQMLDKGKVEVIDNNVVSIEYMEHNKMYIGKDAGNGTVDLYYNSVLVARSILMDSTTVTADGRAVVFAYQVSDENGDRMLALYDGETVTDIGSSAGENFTAVSAKEVYFMQYGDAGFDLMKFNGRKVKEELKDIDNYNFLMY
ncbi:MAG: UDP-N-acetylmuramoyl-tripeptide--D-alanyl-D-alanine ligase [Lachnospiraceae bacterium]|nr:UDP-N-acetylmuramoyl-tripeptide--D-alanyl-D-alanine ligase [Lachnospiraceae bacterium]